MHTGLLELPGAQTCMSRQNSPYIIPKLLARFNLAIWYRLLIDVRAPMAVRIQIAI